MADIVFPALDAACFAMPDPSRLATTASTHAPRFLLLYGSLRERAYSRFLAMELVKFTRLTRDVAPHLTDRYSERKEEGAALEQRVGLRAI